MIAASIAEFGFVNPILVDSNNENHRRPRASPRRASLGLDECRWWCSTVSDWTERHALLADNRLAELAGLRTKLFWPTKSGVSRKKNFDLNLVGFTDEDLDAILAVPEEPQQAPKAEEQFGRAPGRGGGTGDLWLLGDHG